MEQILYIVIRNLSIFRKKRKNLFLCFVAIFIVYGIYVIFLKDFMIQSVSSSGLETSSVHEFTDRLMLSGLLVVVNTTACFGIMQLCIQDEEKGIRRDYLISPITKTQLLISYWVTSVLVSFVYTSFAFIGILFYCYTQYHMILSMRLFIIAILVVFLSSILNSELLLCLITFIKDTTTFSTFGNLYGMLAGFLAGTYLPYSLYPKRLKEILFYYPPTHLTSFMRQIFLSNYETNLKTPYANEISNKLYEIYGIHLFYHNSRCSLKLQFSILIFSFACMLFLLGCIHRESSK